MKRTSGFTIIELMTVLAIISILTAIAVPNIFKWVARSQFNGAVRQVQADVESMRMYAVKENGQATITIANGANSYDTDKWKRGLGTGDPAHKKDTYDLPNGISISSDFANGKLIFNSRGMATPGTITINGINGLSLQIIVNMTGSSRIS